MNWKLVGNFEEEWDPHGGGPFLAALVARAVCWETSNSLAPSLGSLLLAFHCRNSLERYIVRQNCFVFGS